MSILRAFVRSLSMALGCYVAILLANGGESPFIAAGQGAAVASITNLFLAAALEVFALAMEAR